MDRALEFKKRIGQRMRSLRRENGLSQAEVAEGINIAAESYGRLERGLSFPSIPTLASAATLFGTSTDFILGIAPDADRVQTNPPEILRLLHLVRGIEEAKLKRINQAVQLMVDPRRD